MNYPFATIRPDLLEQGLSVPVGDIQIDTPDKLPYRWVGDDFEIFYNKQWLSAESVDFDMD